MNIQGYSRFALVGCALVFLKTAVPASDWPQWRGPLRDGISRETGLLKDWPTGGPALVWQVKDIGYGFSTPAVVGDKIYLLSNKGKEEEYVQSLSAKDGKPVWVTKIGR